MIFCSGLFSAGGMGLWHGVEHWERNKISTASDTELFTQSWPQVSFREIINIMTPFLSTIS